MQMKRYQNGTIELARDCWYIRFTAPSGLRPRFRIGTKKDYPTEKSASRAAQHFREKFNSTPDELLGPQRTFADVVARYEAEEMPDAHSTRRGYMKMHRLYIVPRWGNTLLSQIDAADVRDWLRNGLPNLGLRSIGHLHSQMKCLFKFAKLWKWLPLQAENPMKLFTIPGSTKRSKKPRIITGNQFRALLKHFADDVRMQTMLTSGFLLGLRSSEIFGLKWGDFDHHESTVLIQRGIVENVVGKVKTERSGAKIPMDKFIASTFLRWRGETPCNLDEDWVFASPYKGGRHPMDPKNIQTKILVPAGQAVGLDFNLGWHTLRHSYKSLLDRVTSDASLKRDLMRHADVHTTLQTYGEVEMDRMRQAQSAAVQIAMTE
jgi:integrase